VNAKRKHQGLEEIDAFEFLKMAREKMALLDMDPSFLKRGVNEGFSGGEKKRNEILQMAMLEPRLAILDETASMRCEILSAQSFWLPTTSACSITSNRISSTCCLPEKLYALATNRWH